MARHGHKYKRAAKKARRCEEEEVESSECSGSEDSSESSSSSSDSSSEHSRHCCRCGHKRKRHSSKRHCKRRREEGTPRTAEECETADAGPWVSDAAEVTLQQAAQLAKPGAMSHVRTLRTDQLSGSAFNYLQYPLACCARDKAELCMRLGTDAQHIPCCQLTAALFQPAHFVHLNDEHRWIVLCIRGSQEVADFLTDIVVLQESLSVRGQRGNVHSGFLKSARNLLSTVKPLLLRLKREHPTYRVRVVGHSLGASVAALFTLLVRAELPCARAVVFGVPACVSASLVPETLACVTSFVNRNDPLPAASPHQVGSFIRRFTSALPRIVTGARFVPPGKLFCLCADDYDTAEDGSSPEYTRLQYVDHQFFRELSIRPYPYMCHIADGYEASFSELRCSLRARLGRSDVTCASS